MVDYTARAEQTLQAIERSKAELAKACSDPAVNAEGLAGLANSISNLEGQYKGYYLLSNCQQGGLDKAGMVGAALELLAESSVDTYSGRINDCRRAHADGVKTALRGLSYT